jgi:hypothetical protein
VPYALFKKSGFSPCGFLFVWRIFLMRSASLRASLRRKEGYFVRCYGTAEAVP